jgi:hypothetical protein
VWWAWSFILVRGQDRIDVRIATCVQRDRRSHEDLWIPGQLPERGGRTVQPGRPPYAIGRIYAGVGIEREIWQRILL